MKRHLWLFMALLFALSATVPCFAVGVRQNTGEEISAVAESTADETFPEPAGKWEITDGNLSWYLEKGGDDAPAGTEFHLKTAADLLGLSLIASYREAEIWVDENGKVLSVAKVPEGSSASPTLEKQAYEDRIIRALEGKTVVLDADIDLEGKAFPSIGYNGSFNGTFKGNNKTVSNLYVNPEAVSGRTDKVVYLGLFACLASNGSVSDLTIKNAVLNFEIPADHGGCRVGAVCGSLLGMSYVSNVKVNGLALRIHRSLTSKTSLGLVFGAAFGQIESTVPSENVTVTDCSFTSNFGGTALTDASGVYGRVSGSGVKPTGCSVALNIPDKANIGWYLSAGGAGASEYTLTTAEDLYGFAILSSTAKDLYYDKETGNVVSCYNGWQKDLPVAPLVKDGFQTVKGDKFTGKTVKLANCIDLGGREFWPIGSASSFQGSFDGQGHTLSNAVINEPFVDANHYYGLFGTVVMGSLRNLTVSDIRITVPYAATHIFVGFLGANFDGATNSETVENCNIYNCSVTYTGDGTQGTNYYIGYTLSRIGRNTTCKVENCKVYGVTMTNGLPEGKVTETGTTHDGFTGVELAPVTVTGCEVLDEMPDTSSHLCHVNGDRHVFGEEWLADAEGHYKKCLVPECGEFSDKESHTMEWVVDTKPTETENGKQHKECSECGYVDPDSVGTVIEKLDHVHSVTEVPEVPATCTKPGAHAYYTCSHPGCEGKKYKEEECVNVWEDVTLPVNPDAHTENTDEALHSDGEGHFFLCTACGKEFDREEHSIGNEWKTSDEKHWKECTACGYKTEEAAHTMSWVVDQAATTEKEGSRHEECSVCEAEGKTESIPKIEKGTWDGKTADISWYLANPNAESYLLTKPEELYGFSLLVNFRDFTFFCDSDGKVAINADGLPIYKTPAGSVLPTGSTVPDGLTSLKGSSFPGKTIRLGADMNLNAMPFVTIGHTGSFQGIFDGCGHTVKNILLTPERNFHLAYPTQYRLGFFGCLALGGEVRNLTLSDMEIDVAMPTGSSVGHIGAVACDLQNTASVENVRVERLKISVSSKGGNNTLVLGAALGDDASTGTIKNITVSGYSYSSTYPGAILTEEGGMIGRLGSSASKPAGLLLSEEEVPPTSDALLTVGALTLLSLGGLFLIGKKRKVGAGR